MRAGDVPGAQALLEAVLRSSPTGKKPAEALRLMGSLTLGGEDLTEAERFLREALSQTDDDLAEAIIERDLIRIFLQRGKHQEAFDHSSRLTEIAARHNDPSLVALAQRFQAFTERLLRPLSPEARAFAIALAENRISVPIDDSAGGLHPLMEWAVLLKFSDDFVRARILFKQVLTLTEGRDESLRAPVLFHLAEMECWAGDWLLAAVYVHECEKSIIHTGHRTYARLPLNAKALLHFCRGELEAARAAAQDALAISTTVGDEPYRRRALATLGAVELSAGDVAAANLYFDTLRAGGNQPGYRGTIRSEGDEVEALIAVGRIGDAQAVSARLAAFDDPWQRAIGARSRALLAAAHGDLGTSIREFDLALAAHEELEMPLERARTLLGYGAVLRRTKRKRVAREKLEDALGIFTSLGAAAWLKRVQSELSRIAPASASVGALTPTETRVADLVANGRTNKEVAAELFLSVKTVEANLSHVYDKLHVRSRSELAARVASISRAAPT
jgi:DNA-binding CsgD family transcriptional regulator